MSMKYREKKERLLVALYWASKADVSRYYRLDEVADRISFRRDAGELRTVAVAFRDEGLVNAAFTLGAGPDGGLNMRILGAGIEAAEELLDDYPEYGPEESAEAPASDRYVSLTDNQRAPIAAELAELIEAVRASNDGEEEDRIIALSEIASFEATLSQPRLSTDLIDRFTNQILKWITLKFSDALIKAVVGNLLLKLLPFLAA